MSVTSWNTWIWHVPGLASMWTVGKLSILLVGEVYVTNCMVGVKYAYVSHQLSYFINKLGVLQKKREREGINKLAGQRQALQGTALSPLQP